MATSDAEARKENLPPATTTTMANEEAEEEGHESMKRPAAVDGEGDAAATDAPEGGDVPVAATDKGEAPAAAPIVDGDSPEDAAKTVAAAPAAAAADGSPAAILARPLKRARTAYFLFAEDRRAEVQAQHPGQGVAVVAKALGALWASLTEDEKKQYQDRATEEKERLTAELLAWQAAGGGLVEEVLLPGAADPTGSGGLVFPVARIRKICKLDPDVRGLGKEGLALVTKAAELFLAKLGTETVRVASIQNRRKLQAGDVAQVCATREQFLFLREDLADLARLQQREAQERGVAAAKADDGGSGGAAAARPAPFAAKPMTAFFDVRPK